MKRFALKNDHFRTLCPKVIWIMEGEKSMAEMDQKETEKKRNITVTLSDEDSQMLLEMCGYAGISVGELVENFIRDLTNSNRSNGRDEEYLANSWFNRCGFNFCREPSLLQYLTEITMVEEFMKAWNNMREEQENLQRLHENGPDAIDFELLKINPATHPDVYDYLKKIKEDPERFADYVENCSERLAEAVYEYKYYVKEFEIEFLQVNSKADKADMEREIQAVKDWWTQREQFMQGIEELKSDEMIMSARHKGKKL